MIIHKIMYTRIPGKAALKIETRTYTILTIVQEKTQSCAAQSSCKGICAGIPKAIIWPSPLSR